MDDNRASIGRVVKVITYGSLLVFLWFSVSGALKMTGRPWPRLYQANVLRFKKYHAVLTRGNLDTGFDDTTLRVLYGVSEMFAAGLLISPFDKQATYGLAFLTVLEIIGKAMLRESIWLSSFILWAVFTLLILRWELMRLFAERDSKLRADPATKQTKSAASKSTKAL